MNLICWSVVVWEGDGLAAGWTFEADIHPLLEAHDMIAMVTGRLHILFR